MDAIRRKKLEKVDNALGWTFEEALSITLEEVCGLPNREVKGIIMWWYKSEDGESWENSCNIANFTKAEMIGMLYMALMSLAMED